MKRFMVLAAVLLAPVLASVPVAREARAAEYDVDPAHSFVQFRVQHLGFSWLLGRFDKFSGEFHYDPQAGAEAQRIRVEIDTGSVNTNHAERDKHLRSGDFLETSAFPKAVFESAKYEGDANGGKLHGDLTLHGVSKRIVIDVRKIGEGDDPWGGYRAGFEGEAALTMADFGIEKDLGPKSRVVELSLHIEGIRR